MAKDEILGIDVHEAMMGIIRAIEHKRIMVKSMLTIRAMEKIRIGENGRIDPHSVGPEARALAVGYIGAHPYDWDKR